MIEHIGVTISTGSDLVSGVDPTWRSMESLAVTAEDVGFDSVWLPDHLLWRTEDGDEIGFWEITAVLGAIAVVTKRVEVGASVFCAGFRDPGLLAKIADTLHELSGGRFVLGIGAGGPREEYDWFGFANDHSYSRFAEAVEIVCSLVRGGAATFEGAFHQVRDATMVPRRTGPVSEVLIAAAGPRSLRLAARFADRWTTFVATDPPDPAYLVPILEQLDQACADVGRDPSSLVRSVDCFVDSLDSGEWAELGIGALTGPSGRLAEGLVALGEIGVEEVHCYLRPTIEAFEAMAPVLEIVRRT